MRTLLLVLLISLSSVAFASKCGSSVIIENTTEKEQVVKFYAKGFYRDEDGEVLEERGDSNLTIPINVPPSSKSEYSLFFSCMPLVFSKVEFYYKTKWYSKRKKVKDGHIKI